MQSNTKSQLLLQVDYNFLLYVEIDSMFMFMKLL